MATVTINTDANGEEWAELTIDHVLDDYVEFEIGSNNGGTTFDIDWGDGTIDTDLGVGSHSHTYVGTANLFRIKCDEGLEKITKIYNDGNPLNTVGNISEYNQFINLIEIRDYSNNLIPFDTSEIPRHFTHITFIQPLTGDVIDLPPNLNYFSSSNNNQAIISGNIKDIPQTISTFSPAFSNLSGSINDIPSNCFVFNIPNNIGNVTGNIGLLPNLVTFRYYGPNTITGDIANLPSTIDFFVIRNGSNTIYGNLQDIPSNLRIFLVEGLNIIEGDFSNVSVNLDELTIKGNNNISGNLSDLAGKFLFTLIIYGNNTITGDISNIDINTTFDIKGNNTISGDLGLVANFPSIFIIEGNNDVRRLTALDTFRTTLAAINILSPPTNMTSTELDSLIADLAVASATISVNFKIVGLNRTAASDADVATIQSNGGSVTII